MLTIFSVVLDEHHLLLKNGDLVLLGMKTEIDDNDDEAEGELEKEVEYSCTVKNRLNGKLTESPPLKVFVVRRGKPLLYKMLLR